MQSEQRQTLLVVGIAGAIIICSIFATLWATGVLFSGGASSDRGYQNVTFTDAVISCREQAQSTYQGRIQTLATDNHSSRYDQGSYVYKIFMQMDLFDRKKERASLHYVNCFVHAGNGQIRKFEVLEHVDEKQERVSDDTNMFGMPKKK